MQKLLACIIVTATSSLSTSSLKLSASPFKFRSLRPNWRLNADNSESLSDDELLARMRQEKQRTQDNWQLSLIKRDQLGKWFGSGSLFLPEDADAQHWPLAAQWACQSEFGVKRFDDGSQQLELQEHGLPSSPHDEAVGRLFSPTVASIRPEALRPAEGCQAVGKSYSFWSGFGSEDEVVIELGIAEKGSRVRVKTLYTPETYEDEKLTHKLRAFTVLREKQLGVGEAPDESFDYSEDAMFNSGNGKGLYDMPVTSEKGNAVSFYLEGPLTVRLPITGGQFIGALSMDWSAGEMRYQVDRKFRSLAGPITSLECIEIGTATAETLPPSW